MANRPAILGVLEKYGCQQRAGGRGLRPFPGFAIAVGKHDIATVADGDDAIAETRRVGQQQAGHGQLGERSACGHYFFVELGVRDQWRTEHTGKEQAAESG